MKMFQNYNYIFSDVGPWQPNTDDFGGPWGKILRPADIEIWTRDLVLPPRPDYG